MSKIKLRLPWGQESIDMILHDQWRLAGEIVPASRRGAPDVQEEVRHSLADAIGSQRLSQLARPGMKIAVVIDDDSRPTPMSQIFPAVVDELRLAGVTLDRVVVVPALGLHRPMTDDELAQRIGREIFSQVQVGQHDPDDSEKLAYLGETRRGTPVWLNREVTQADLVISIGCIEPHIIASFGGGYKNLLPGVAGRASIAHNHSLNCQPDTFNSVGQPIENNPMRLDLEEAGAMLKPPVFIVNAVLNSSLEVVRVVSGHPIEAHRVGAQVSASIYGASIPAQADVVITDSHPMDQDLRQGVKALANTVRALRPGGVMITVVRAAEGVGVFGLANRKLPVGRRALKILAPLILPRIPRMKIQGMGEEDRFFLFFALQAMRQGDLLLYAPTIPGEVRQRLPFVQFVDGITEAVELAKQRFPGKADVLVFPHGGITYPILP
jgi:nickel-dependent lactate racemase